MIESDAPESPTDPPLNPESTAPKAKRQKPCPSKTFPIPMAETSAHGHHRTRSMAFPRQNTVEGLNIIHIPVLSSHEISVPQSQMPITEEPTATTKPQIPVDITWDMKALSPTEPTTSRNTTKSTRHPSSSKGHKGKLPRGSVSQQSTTPTRSPTLDVEENLKIRLVKPRKTITKLREYENKYKVLFHFVKDVNKQVRDSNMKLYVQNYVARVPALRGGILEPVLGSRT